MRENPTNPTQTPVSTVLDNHGNRIDRYESDGQVTLRVTLAPRWRDSSPEDRTRAALAVEDWYWRHVGTYDSGPRMDDGKPLDDWQPLEA